MKTKEGVRPAKILALAILAVTALPTVLEAQGGALSVSGGWTFGGSMDVREGRLNSAASGTVAGELAFRVRPDGLGVLYVSYQPSKLRIDRFGEPNRELYDMDIWYFMGGGTVELLDRGPAVPYGTFLIGFAWFNPGGTAAESAQVGSETMFASMLGGGVRIPLADDDRVQIRLDGRLNLAFPYGGVGMWCGTGGCSGTFSGWVGPVQGHFSAGLRLGFGETRRTPAARGSRRRR